MHPSLRWGLLSTADIARKNWQSILLSGNGVVSAVASRDPAKARRFIQECQSTVPFAEAPRAVGSYEELIASPDLDAIYVPLPTGLRKEWVVRAANAGKHVICEKPCAANAADLREMIEACQRHQVQFMDGTMYVHTRRLARFLEVVHDRTTVGEIRRVTAQFSFRAPQDFTTSNIRSNSVLEPMGCLGDLGWYCTRFILVSLPARLPRLVTGRLLSRMNRPDAPGDVPAEFSAEFLYDDGVSAGFYCSFLTEHQQLAHVSGTKGNAHMLDFVLPFEGEHLDFQTHQATFAGCGCDYVMKPNAVTHSTPEYANSHPSAQETNLFRNFNAAALSGQRNSYWPDIAFRTQLLLDACLRSALEGKTVELLGHAV